MNKLNFGGHWWVLHQRLIVLERPKPGVYELASASREILYIGASQNILERLMQHLAEKGKGKDCFGDVAYFRVKYVDDCDASLRHLLWEYAAVHQGHLPPCNETSA